MAERRIIDYYAILAVPPTADLAGIENAYVRLSGDLAVQVHEDETAATALQRLNEAYGVLAFPGQREEYDRLYFSKEIADLEQQRSADTRRQTLTSFALIGSLAVVVIAQSLVLGYLGREYVSAAADFVFGPLLPGSLG